MKNKKSPFFDEFIIKTLGTLGNENVFNYLLFSFKEDLYRLDEEISNEQAFAKENPPRSTYGSAGSDARRRVKYLKRIRKEHVLLIKKLTLCFKMKTRLEKME